MGHSRLTYDEIGQRGQSLYERQVRAQVEPHHVGKYAVIDIETGEYEVGDDSLALSERMLARHDGAALYAVRIGSPATGRIGGRLAGVGT